MTTERARAVPNAMHTHATAPGSLSTTDFAASVYAATGTIVGINPDDTANGGLATTVARGDHRHAAPCAAPGNIAPDDAAAEGNSTSFARANHVHGFACATAAALTKTATASEGVAVTSARSDHVHATSALPWGLVAQQQLTSSSSAFSASGATDMALNNVSVVSGRRYAISLHGLAAINAAVGLWHVNLHVNGTYLDTFARVINGAASAQRYSVDGTVYWTAPTTQATDDFTVVLDERTDGSTLTLIGGTTTADPPRTFTIVDIGVAV